jgi:hypothetical protein
MASPPTRGTRRRLTASSAIKRTVACGRLTADHSDDSLLLTIIEQSDGGPRFVVEGSIQSVLFEPMAHPPYCLGGQRDESGMTPSAT